MRNSVSVQHAERFDLESDARQYRWLSMVFFAYFLVIALVCRMLPRHLRPFSSPTGERRSVLAEARIARDTYTPYGFAG